VDQENHLNERRSVMSENKVSRGISFLELLFIVLLVLKLTDTIDWSWLWITTPLWGDFVVTIIVAIGAAFVYAMAKLYKFMFRKF